MKLIEYDKEHQAGEVLDFDEQSVVVGCSKGSLQIATLQPASKKAMSTKAYCVGRGIKVGHSLF